MIFTLWEREHVMKRSRFTEEQIAFAIKQSELGTKVEEICRKMGISVDSSDTLSQIPVGY
jgi:putative transposase